jgi:hypothetical protein
MRLVRRLLEEQSEHLVFFVRGDGITPEIEGANLLLANLLHKIGLNPKDFSTFLSSLPTWNNAAKKTAP